MEPDSVHTPLLRENFHTRLSSPLVAPFAPSATYSVSGPLPVPRLTKANWSGSNFGGRLAPERSGKSAGDPLVGAAVPITLDPISLMLPGNAFSTESNKLPLRT